MEAKEQMEDREQSFGSFPPGVWLEFRRAKMWRQ